MPKPILNVYSKFDRPKELHGYGNEYHINLLISRLNSSGRLTEGDKEVLSNNLGTVLKDPQSTYYYARDIIKGRWKKAESDIMKYPKWSCFYAMNILKGRWSDIGKPGAEEIIMKDPESAYLYANTAIEGRWEDAEPYIMKDPKSSYNYARTILRKRWAAVNKPEAEEIIMKVPEMAAQYAISVIGRRWSVAEPYIKKNQYMWDQYKDYFEIKE